MSNAACPTAGILLIVEVVIFPGIFYGRETRPQPLQYNVLHEKGRLRV